MSRMPISKRSSAGGASSPMVDRRSKRSGTAPGTERRAMARTLDAIPDVPDFRDQLYEVTLVEVPSSRSLDEYRSSSGAGIPILDQGREGACTGYALAAVAHYLLRTRKTQPWDGFNEIPVSPLMLYNMARRYDEWPGEDYSGSSARGAMKAWHKHGVCAEGAWTASTKAITTGQAEDARKRPLGAYYRVNHHDLVCMHAALAEVGILYATASVHSGWNRVKRDGIIPYEPGSVGGHAFAIVGYDQEGFWIQNSWGPSWGRGGFGRICYDDWLMNGSDVWVARLGVPLTLTSAAGTVATQSAGASPSKSYGFSDLRPHIISIGNDGALRATGTYGTDRRDVKTIVDHIVATVGSWPSRRILLYAHGGLVGEEHAVQKVAELRASLLGQQVYPVSMIWKTDYGTTLKNILDDASRRRRPEGALDAAKEFMLDRADDLLEPLARTLTGKAAWSEMKENARLATQLKSGGARIFLDELMSRIDPATGRPYAFEFHLVAHSAGSIFHAALAQYLGSRGKIARGPLKNQTGIGQTIASCTLWAPACNMALFEEAYAPLIEAGRISRFTIFALTDSVEQDDHCAGIYHKSLLYLVANAFEDKPRIPLLQPHGTPILGMEKFLKSSVTVQKLKQKGALHVVLSPNTNAVGSADASRSRTHGGFDDDDATLHATLAAILSQRTAMLSEASERASEKARRGRVSRAWLQPRA